LRDGHRGFHVTVKGSLVDLGTVSSKHWMRDSWYVGNWTIRSQWSPGLVNSRINFWSK